MDLQEFAAKCPEANWTVYENPTNGQQWEVLPFGNCRGTWKRFRRALYCRPLAEDGQYLFRFARPETVLYTNLGMGFPIDEQLHQAGLGDWLTDVGMLERYHARGGNELVHRAVKDFGTEQLPFKRFESNTAFYYTMLVAFNLFEAFKEDVASEVIPVTSYATTVRANSASLSKLFDLAAKIVRSSGQITLKVTEAVWSRLDFGRLWQRANLGPVVALQ